MSIVSVSVADFRLRHPEFTRAPDDLVAAMLAEAEEDVDADVWGPKAEAGVCYLAAHKLALSPYGQNARLASPDTTTTYSTEYERLLGLVAFGYRTI